MNNRKTLLLFFGLVLIFSSFISLTDYSVDLGDNYTFHAKGGWKTITPNQVYINTQIYSEVTNYKFDDRFIVAKQKPDYEYYKTFVTTDYSVRFIIYSGFLKDSTSKDFLDPFIRQSIKADSSFYKLLKNKGVTDQNSLEDQKRIKVVLDSIFHTDPFYIRLFSSKENYWIIDKDNNIRYGPFTKDEYEKERKSKNVQIKLEEE